MMNLNRKEILEDEAFNHDINIQKVDLPCTISGLYYDDGYNEPLIALNSSIDTQSEACCVIAEELGHYYTSCGNLLTDPYADNTFINQQENRAKKWAIKKLVSLNAIIDAFVAGSKDLYEMSEFLGVTELFLRDSFQKYSTIYGKYSVLGDYIIYFDPPGVLKAFRNKGE
ncbi:MAG: ImmA/IrrE family metallo-endopeptidase [Ruminiclostridium sp.]